jgi:hypothetical protein
MGFSKVLVTRKDAFVGYTLVTMFVSVPFRSGVIRVVIDVKLTSPVVYVTFVTGHQSALTFSWITKRSFVGCAVAEA